MTELHRYGPAVESLGLVRRRQISQSERGRGELDGLRAVDQARTRSEMTSIKQGRDDVRCGLGRELEGAECGVGEEREAQRAVSSVLLCVFRVLVLVQVSDSLCGSTGMSGVRTEVSTRGGETRPTLVLVQGLRDVSRLESSSSNGLELLGHVVHGFGVPEVDVLLVLRAAQGGTDVGQLLRLAQRLGDLLTTPRRRLRRSRRGPRLERRPPRP